MNAPIECLPDDERNGIFHRQAGETDEEFRRRVDAALEDDAEVGRQQISRGEFKTLEDLRRELDASNKR